MQDKKESQTHNKKIKAQPDKSIIITEIPENTSIDELINSLACQPEIINYY